MRAFITSLSLLGWLAGSALATCDTACSPYTIPLCAKDANNVCLAPASPVKRAFTSHLFRRACDTCTLKECSTADKKCTPGGVGPPHLDQTVPLLCGKKPTEYTVHVTYDAVNKNLVFKLSSTLLELPKLEISKNHLTSDNSGLFRYKDTCVGDTCTVPISRVLTTEGLTEADLCNLTLWIGLHTGYNGDTCWPQGSEINDGDQNWAQEFSITFDCPTVPDSCCCCPPAVTPPDKKCSPETGYAKGANTYDLSALGCTKSWGYYQKYPANTVNGLLTGSVVYTADLLAGKTIDVGDVTVKKISDTCFSVTLDAATGYGIGKTHIDISCKNPADNLGTFCRSPGKYEFNSGCFDVDPYTSDKSICVESACTDSYYFIIHAETYTIVHYDPANPGPYDTCSAYTCTAG